MAKSLIHTLIIWSEATQYFETIKNDISTNFETQNIFNFSWEKEIFPTNLKRFYSHSLKDKNETDLDRIINSKIEHCGNENFILFIFEDKNPNFEDRLTSSGTRKVNANVFDCKASYREITGGGHKIHASDNEFESNKDISLLLGVSLDNLQEHFPKSKDIIQYNKNVIGVPQWNSLKELFFVLNNSINYVVLRNFEGLPDQYTLEGHGDIDLLVEDYNYIKYLTGSKNVFPDSPLRVHHVININNEEVPFDFRHLGDNYYDNTWENEILTSRVYTENEFYIPNEKNHFYSLLYHALIHKHKIADDYILKITEKGNEYGISTNEINSSDRIQLLNEFMTEQSYLYTLPLDPSVTFNMSNISNTDLVPSEKYGTKVSSSVARTDSESFFTEVYKKENCYIKIASHPISFNENRFLKILTEYPYFPNIISFSKEENYDVVEISEAKGFNFLKINEVPSFWKKANLIEFLKHTTNLLEALNQKEIIHRDIKPDNIILTKDNKGNYTPVLIDFGWAIHKEDIDIPMPLGLGMKWKKPGDKFSDLHSICETFREFIYNFDFIKTYINSLTEIDNAELSTKERSLALLRLKDIDVKFNFNDNKYLLMKKVNALLKANKLSWISKFLRRAK
jgi:hypothetical protein